jgi:hypothetical protein
MRAQIFGRDRLWTFSHEIASATVDIQDLGASHGEQTFGGEDLNEYLLFSLEFSEVMLGLRHGGLYLHGSVRPASEPGSTDWSGHKKAARGVQRLGRLPLKWG